MTSTIACPRSAGGPEGIVGWSEAASFTLNGTPLDVEIGSGGWATLERTWEPGDKVVMTLPMALRIVAVDPQHPHRVAVLYGPVVLAQDEACCRCPFTLAPQTALETRLVRNDPGLRFRILNTVPERHTRYLLPLYALPALWPYWVYFDLQKPPLY